MIFCYRIFLIVAVGLGAIITTFLLGLLSLQKILTIPIPSMLVMVLVPCSWIIIAFCVILLGLIIIRKLWPTKNDREPANFISPQP